LSVFCKAAMNSETTYLPKSKDFIYNDSVPLLLVVIKPIQLLTSNGTESVALDVGTTSQVLTANSSVADGIKWANLLTTPAGSADYGVIIGTTPSNGVGTISIGYGAGSINSDATNCIVIGTNSNCGSGTSNTILMGTGTSVGVSNEFNLPQIEHFNIPSLTTSADGTGTLLQYGGTNTGWVQASGGTYNSVSKIDTVITDLQTDVIIANVTNMAIGGESFGTGVTGQHCTAAGDGALKSLTTGSYNTAFGFDSLSSVTTQASNVSMGDYALQSCSGNQNTAVGSSCFIYLNTGDNNVGLGWQAGAGVNTGSNNIAIGYSAANSTNDTAATNNIYICPNTATSVTGVSNSIMLGSGATSGVSNEFMISNIHHLNIPALTTSADGTGTLLQYGGANADWVEALGGTYNLVEKIDTAISSINLSITTLQNNSSVSTTGPFTPTFSSEVNCTATNINSGYSWYGEDFYNLYMLFTLDVTGSSISSFSVDISGIVGEYNTAFTPTAIVSISGGTSL